MGSLRALRNLDRRVIPVVGGLLRVGRHRRRRPVLGGIVLLTSLALLGAAAWLVSAEPDRPAPAKVQIGVTEGQSVPEYVQHARQALDRLATSARPGTRVYALVSFAGYLPPDRLADILAGVESQQVYVRVPRRGAAGSVAELPAHDVPADVTSGMTQLARDRERIAADFARLARSADGAARDRYRWERHAYQVEADQYRRHCRCVFAGVVRGTPNALRAVADRSAVRAVDPARTVRSLTDAVFTPPLPEQTGAALPPGVESALPSPSRTGRRTRTPAPPTGPASPASPWPSPSEPTSASPTTPSATPSASSGRSTGRDDPTAMP